MRELKQISIGASIAATLALVAPVVLAQTGPNTLPLIDQPLYAAQDVKVSGSVYVDIAVNYGAVPSILNYRGESYFVFTPIAFSDLDTLRRDMRGRNITAQFDEVIDLKTVREIETFIQQVYGSSADLDHAVQNSLLLVSAGNRQRRQSALSALGQPSGFSTIERYRFFEEQLNEPIAALNNREEDGGVVFETIRILRPNPIQNEHD